MLDIKRKWPSHACRRARHRQSLTAALDLAKSRGAIIDAVIQDHSNDVDEELVSRLAAQVPCLKAQIDAAANGFAAHSSAQLVSRGTHVLSTAARHQFSESHIGKSVADARRLQRGASSKLKEQGCLPPPPPPLPVLMPNAITCEAFEKFVLPSQCCSPTLSGSGWFPLEPKYKQQYSEDLPSLRCSPTLSGSGRFPLEPKYKQQYLDDLLQAQSDSIALLCARLDSLYLAEGPSSTVLRADAPEFVPTHCDSFCSPPVVSPAAVQVSMKRYRFSKSSDSWPVVFDEIELSMLD